MDSTSEIISRRQRENSKTKNDGFTQIENTFVQSCEYSVYEKLVYLVLKSHCFKANLSWPSINRIVSCVPCARNTVISSLKKLSEKGDIERVSGTHKSNTYKLKRGPFNTPNTYIK